MLELFEKHTLPVVEVTNEYLKTIYIKFKEFSVEEHLLDIVYLIGKLHNLKVDYVFNPFEIIKKSKIKIEYDKARINALEKIWEQREKVLCHNDLLLSNFGYTGNKFILFDFEFAGMNDRLFDIASFITENNLFHLEHELEHLFGVNDIELLREYYYLNDVLWTIWGHEMGHEKLIKDKENRIKKGIKK